MSEERLPDAEIEPRGVRLPGTWFHHHKVSERLAACAEIALRRGDVSGARKLYAQAAEAEERALTAIERGKTRTVGISAVSAVALYCKAAQFELAERLAHQWLASERLPSHAAEQLRGLLESACEDRGDN